MKKPLFTLLVAVLLPWAVYAQQQDSVFKWAIAANGGLAYPCGFYGRDPGPSYAIYGGSAMPGAGFNIEGKLEVPKNDQVGFTISFQYYSNRYNLKAYLNDMALDANRGSTPSYYFTGTSSGWYYSFGPMAGIYFILLHHEQTYITINGFLGYNQNIFPSISSSEYEDGSNALVVTQSTALSKTEAVSYASSLEISSVHKKHWFLNFAVGVFYTKSQFTLNESEYRPSPFSTTPQLYTDSILLPMMDFNITLGVGYIF